MQANRVWMTTRAADAAPQLERPAFPSHLARMLKHCIEADFDDEEHRSYVRRQALPLLIRHRRDLLLGSRIGWLNRSDEYRADVLERSRTIRNVVLAVHLNLIQREPSNIVSLVSFRAAIQA